MNEQKNLLIAMALTLLVLVGFQYFFAPPPNAPATNAPAGADAPTGTEGQGRARTNKSSPAGQGDISAAVGRGEAVAREVALARSERVIIDTPSLTGSIALTGGRIDDLTLRTYFNQPGESGGSVVLLNPAGSEPAYYAGFGWLPHDDQGLLAPGLETVWTTEDTRLTPDSPVTLNWTSPQGLEFTREISIDDKYMFTIVQRVRNPRETPAVLKPFALINRRGTPATQGFFILHEGPLGVFESGLQEVDYETLREDGPFRASSVGGWLGITDKYWLTAIVPEQDVPFDGRFLFDAGRSAPRYQADYLEKELVVPAGESKQVTVRFFAGAKEVDVINRYKEAYGITLFDRAVDWGWFLFLTKPIFYLLDWLYGLMANFGLAILALTVLVKLLFFPLANKSYVSMSKMKLVQPKMKRLQERYKDDKPRLQQEMMELYKKEKINPMSGCLPVLIQIPVFFALYKVLFVTIEMRHAPGFFWVDDLSAPDPLLLTNLFGLIPWTPPDFLALGVWPVLMGVAMYFQMRLNPTTGDELQRKVLLAMPFVFMFILARFPAGLVIYWTWNTVLTGLQQWMIMRRHGAANAEG